MENKKYRLLTDESINYLGRTLYRIEALRDFSNVKAGEKGGYIEHEGNLSHKGDCWLYDNAKAYDNAEICGNAVIGDNAVIGGNAEIWGNARIWGDAVIEGDCWLYDNAKAYDNAEICGNARICDNAVIGDNAEIWGNARIWGDAVIWGDAEIEKDSDYIVFKNWWSSGRHFTWTRSNNKWKVGCFYGTGEELIKKAYKDSPKKGREYERVVKYVESILEDERKENNQDKGDGRSNQHDSGDRASQA